MLALKNGKYVVTDDAKIHLPDIEIPYDEKVVSLIRQKYSLDEELAIQRQRDSKPEEFNAYFTYCEKCKELAKKD